MEFAWALFGTIRCLHRSTYCMAFIVRYINLSIQEEELIKRRHITEIALAANWPKASSHASPTSKISVVQGWCVDIRRPLTDNYEDPSHRPPYQHYAKLLRNKKDKVCMMTMLFVSKHQGQMIPSKWAMRMVKNHVRLIIWCLLYPGKRKKDKVALQRG